jgi:putative nucleotidyltransferase with HDIG domain
MATNERLVHEIAIREENERLRSALLGITDCASDTLTAAELCREIHMISGSVLYAPNFSIALVDEGNMLLDCIYFSDERMGDNSEGNKLFNAMNRYVLGTQKAACFSKDSFPVTFNGSSSEAFPASWIGAPLRLGGPPFGIVSIHSYNPQKIYTEKELGMLSSLTPQIASTLDRARIHEKLRRYQLELESKVAARTSDLVEANKSLTKTINLTVEVLSSASEIRDPYTAGHQKRVTKIALKIAQRMNLSDDVMESIRVAGTLHDFGKISVPIEILTKPGKLNELETDFIHTHAQTGYDILRIIPFKGPIADIVHQHHEKLDGSGYPRGIKGDAILLESRIITVADIVEAISSHRPYRASLGMPAAIEEITAHRGTFYDPDVVDACLKIITDPDEDLS